VKHVKAWYEAFKLLFWTMFTNPENLSDEEFNWRLAYVDRLMAERKKRHPVFKS
jgi:hypothetical protein